MDNNNKWKKILYEEQGYSDNYTDKTFLKDLHKNIDIQEVALTDAILGSMCFVQELCTVIAFVSVYIYLYNDWVEPVSVIVYTSVMAVVGFLFCSSGLHELQNVTDHIRTLFIFYVFGVFFSPVLYTLTDTISTDTIYSTTVFMMLIHLIFFDYGVPSSIVSNSLSLNAALFASICLASRLSSAAHALVLITVGIQCFLLFPLLRNKCRQSTIMTICLVISVTYMLWTVSKIVTMLFIISLGLINVFFPLLFIKYQIYKDNIHGPWDEAIINNAGNINDLIYS